MSAIKRQWINETSASQHITGVQNVPQDIRAERSVLGSILLAGETGDGSHLISTVPFLRYDHFFSHRHGLIYRTLEVLFAESKAIDKSTVTSELSNRGFLDAVGGEAYIHQLMQDGGANVEHYAKSVAEMAVRRSALMAADKLKAIAVDRDIPLSSLATRAQRTIADPMQFIDTITGQTTFSLAEQMQAYQERIVEDMKQDDFEPGYSTGFAPLDRRVLGLRDEKLYVIAGGPGSGKSALQLTMAINLFLAGRTVAFISLELTRDEIVERTMAILTGISHERIQRRALTKQDLDRIKAKTAQIAKIAGANGFHIAELNAPTILDLDMKVDEMHLRYDFDVLFADYLGWNTIAWEKGMDTVRMTGKLWNAANAWKKIYSVPVIAGCQINREFEQRSDKRPKLSDLSDTSLIANNADAVIGIYREDLFTEVPEKPNQTELIILKNRSGSGGTGVVYVKAELACSRFVDWQDDDMSDVEF